MRSPTQLDLSEKDIATIVGRALGAGITGASELGGGTFAATVLRRTARGFEIIGTPEGVERLGGADFDDAIFAHVNYLAGGALTGIDLSDERTVVAVARLRQDCTLAKEALSVDLEAVIPVHTHIDHVMDSALVADRTGARLIGGRSAANVGRGYGLPEDRVVVTNLQRALPGNKIVPESTTITAANEPGPSPASAQ